MQALTLLFTAGVGLFNFFFETRKLGLLIENLQCQKSFR